MAAFDDPDVEILDEYQDAGSVVDAADADVVQAAVETQGDGAGLADAVGADAVVGVEASSWGCFGAGLVGGRGGGALVQGVVRTRSHPLPGNGRPGGISSFETRRSRALPTTANVLRR
ncbi:MAG: hypothetical protein QOJ80_2515 [Mycobacterium sp.]|nr:hypothetical protein [Mycobacterium sp.]